MGNNRRFLISITLSIFAIGLVVVAFLPVGFGLPTVIVDNQAVTNRFATVQIGNLLGDESDGRNLVLIDEQTEDISNRIFAIQTVMESNPSTDISANRYGAFLQAHVAPSNVQNFTGNLYGAHGQVDHEGTGTLFGANGVRGTVGNRDIGTINNAYGVTALVANLSTGIITNAYGVYISNPTNSGGGTIGNNYGLYLQDQTAAGTNYAIYSAGGTNYFGGNVTLGSGITVGGYAFTYTAPLTISGVLTNVRLLYSQMP